MTATCTGEVVAVYHYKEGEVEKAPAIVGETALLAGSEGQYSVRPCGYRSALCFGCKGAILMRAGGGV